MRDRHASSRAAQESAANLADAARVSVLLPLPLAGAYDYVAARDLALKPGDFVVAPLAPGDFVRVPLGSRSLDGVVWSGGSGDVAPEKLKSVLERRPAPPL